MAHRIRILTTPNRTAYWGIGAIGACASTTAGLGRTVIEGLERCPSSEYAREVALIGESASKGHSVFPYAPPFNIEPTLTAFAQGIRQNDIFEQMRAIARRLTRRNEIGREILRHAVMALIGSSRENTVSYSFRLAWPTFMARAFRVTKMMAHSPIASAGTFAVLMPICLGGCSVGGAPSFELFGAFFPGWMFCALIGIFGAVGARAAFVGTGFSNVVPHQLLVCTAMGVIAATLAWLLWFGR